MTRVTPDDSKAAPYQRIASALRARIGSGELAPGDKLPSTRALATRFGVALATATRALASLKQEGLVVARARSGVRVADAPAAVAPPRARPESMRDRMVAEAIAIADAEGIDAVTMRSIAAKLGVATMGLYRHIADKDALVLAMADAAFGEVELPRDRPAGWRACLELAARLQWSIYQRHPWLAQLLTITRPMASPNLLAHAEWILAALDELALDPPTRLHIHVAMFSYVRGIAIDLEAEARARADTGVTDAEWMDGQIAAFTEVAEARGLRRFGALIATLSAPSSGYDFHLDGVFEFGLGPLLDGLERVAARGGDGARGAA